MRHARCAADAPDTPDTPDTPDAPDTPSLQRGFVTSTRLVSGKMDERV